MILGLRVAENKVYRPSAYSAELHMHLLLEYQMAGGRQYDTFADFLKMTNNHNE